MLKENVTLLEDNLLPVCTHRPVTDVEHPAVEHGLGPGDHRHVAGVLGVKVWAAGRDLGKGGPVNNHLVHGVDPDNRLLPIAASGLSLVLSWENKSVNYFKFFFLTATLKVTPCFIIITIGVELTNCRRKHYR